MPSHRLRPHRTSGSMDPPSAARCLSYQHTTAGSKVSPTMECRTFPPGHFPLGDFPLPFLDTTDISPSLTAQQRLHSDHSYTIYFLEKKSKCIRLLNSVKVRSHLKSMISALHNNNTNCVNLNIAFFILVHFASVLACRDYHEN